MSNKKNITILTIFFIIISVIFGGKCANMLIDFSREVYIPYQMQLGDSLVKDIFLIYGPLGYIINSLIYKISININLLIFEAHILSYGILILFYYILNCFFTKKVSLIFSLFFLIFSIFSNSTFSFVLPYSYSVLWAVFGTYGTLYSLLYNKKSLTFLFLGLILASRIEYFIPIFIISIFYLLYRKEKIAKNLLYIFIFPIICVCYFLISKVSFDDIIKNYTYITMMLKTNALQCFYRGMGSYFDINYFKHNLEETTKLFLIVFLSYIFYLIKKPILSYLAAIVGFVFLNCLFSFNLILFFALFLTILMFRKYTTKEEIIFFLFGAVLCSKAAFAINTLSYSNFGFFIILYYTFLELQKIINKKWLINILIIFFIFCFTDTLSYHKVNKKYKAETPTGTVWLNKENINLFKAVNIFIENNIKKEENFIVIPEGQIFNLIHKKPYGFYNSTFTPLDFETFKEEELTKKLIKNKTDYIFFYPRNTLEYGAQTICRNYGVDFCKYIMDNYTHVGTIQDGYTILIFKRKNEKERNNRNITIRLR